MGTSADAKRAHFLTTFQSKCADTRIVGMNIGGKRLVKALISLRLLIVLSFYPRFAFLALPVLVCPCVCFTSHALIPPVVRVTLLHALAGSLRVPVIYGCVILE